MTTRIWLYMEQRQGVLSEASLALISEGQRLSRQCDAELSSVLLGHELRDLAETLAWYGTEKLYYAEHVLLQDYTTDAYALVLTSLIEEQAPSIVLFTDTHTGRDLAIRIAARLKVGIAAECVDLDIDDEGKLIATRSIYNDSVYIKIAFKKTPQIACIRPEVLDVQKPANANDIEIINVKPVIEGDDIRTKVIDFIEADPRTLELKEADSIIGIGRGLGNSENLEIIYQLSDILKAAVGGSRVAIDAGWLSKQKQIGISGSTVAPKLYIACGISGASHHMSGAKNAKKIIAINTDRRAPIFDTADLGIVGDVMDIVPHLIKRLSEGDRK